MDQLKHLHWSNFSGPSALILLLLAVGHAARRISRRRNLPPGPPGVPVLGNVLETPSRYLWLKLTEWSEQYGHIFSLNMAGQSVIVLNTYKTATALLESRADIYSDRPRAVMVSEIMTNGMTMAFSDYNDRWRRMRRATNDGFSVRACERYQPQQWREAARNVIDMINAPEKWVENIQHSVAAGIWSALYAWPRPTPTERPLVERIHAHVVEYMGAALPGKFMVDFFPFMKYLPTWTAPWKRYGLAWYKREGDFLKNINDGIRSRTATGDTQPCFVRGLQEKQDRFGMSEDESAWLLGDLLSAGTDTTYTALQWFVLAMIQYPDVRIRAQAELDAVVGRDRLPKFEDKGRLPYIVAIVRETLRWRPVGPLGVPRKTRKDDWFEGQLIPSGSTIITNLWAMTRDPDVFPEGDEFRPERYTDKEPASPIDDKSRGFVRQEYSPYGFGKRVCPGAHYANQVLFIQMAMLLWAFDFLPALAQDGTLIIPKREDYIDAGIVVFPKPFKVRIIPRAADVLEIVTREAEVGVTSVGST